MRTVEGNRLFSIRSIFDVKIFKYTVGLVIFLLITFWSNVFAEVFFYPCSTGLQILNRISQFYFFLIHYCSYVIVFPILGGSYFLSTSDWSVPIKISSLSGYIEHNFRLLRSFLNQVRCILLVLWLSLVIIIRITEYILIRLLFFYIFRIFNGLLDGNFFLKGKWFPQAVWGG